MVLIINRSLSAPWTQLVSKIFHINLRNGVLKRCVASDALPQELRQEQESQLRAEKKPSKPPFVKNLFLGIFDADLLIYPEIFTIEHFDSFNSSLEPVKKYFNDEINSKDIDAKAKLPEKIIKQLKAFNLCGLRIPREYGGKDVSATEYACISEVTSLDSSVSLLLAAHQSLGIQSILLSGSEEQKLKYLPKLASGEWLAAFCISEEVSGSDLASVQTTADKEEIDSWTVNGKKLWVANGANANIFIILAQTVGKTQFGESKGVSAFIVERDFPGVFVSKPTNMIGAKGAGICEITLNNVVVPESNLIGELGSGFKLAIDVLSSNRFIAGANTITLLKKLFGQVTEHITHRKQLNTSLMDCEQIQKHIAEVALMIYALESMTYMTTGLHDRFQDYDGSVENAIVKVFAMEQGHKCIDICLNLLGARSYMADNPYEKYSRDFRTMSIFDGALDITKLYISLMGLFHSGSSLNEDVKKFRNPFDYSGFILKNIFFSRRDVNDNPKLDLELYLQLHSSLNIAAKQLEYCVLRLKYAVLVLFRNHGADVVNHQLDIIRLTSVVIDIYAMTAVLGRASRAYCTGLAYADDEILLAQKYCFDAHKRVKKNINEIIDGADLSGDVFYFKIAEDIFQHRGYCIEHPTKRNI